MVDYYYIENDVQLGPFSLQDLKIKGIQRNTLVWTENMENWEEARNIQELNEILKSKPPPIPIKSNFEKPFKFEAEIIRKKEKIISPESEIIIAKETKQNYKFVKYSFLIGLIGFILLVYKDNGFANKYIEFKLERDMNRSASYYEGEERVNFLQNRENLKNESYNLGGGFPPHSFSTFFALQNHKDNFNESLKKSIIPSLLIALISSLILIFGRYILKGAKWVEEKSIN